MKILKVFGIVVGIHVFALMLIFANPGCSSSSKPPATTDTVTKTDAPAPAITVPNIPPASEPIPAGFNPDAPATAAPASGGIRFSPTRPNTPVASTLTAEPVRDVTPMTTYTVKSGDSLWTIANKNKVGRQELATANNLKVTAILQPGQKLIIPGKNPTAGSGPVATTPVAPAMTPAVAPAAADTSKPAALHHKVATGDTLGSIALKYGVRERDLALANNIADPRKLQLGKELVIPGWDSASGKAVPKSTGKSATAPKTTVEKSTPAPAAEAAVPVISIDSQPASSSAVPVIRVDETPRKP